MRFREVDVGSGLLEKKGDINHHNNNHLNLSLIRHACMRWDAGSTHLKGG